MEIYIILFLFFIGALAGFVDTIAGGGGILTLPALLMTGIDEQTALATNKLQSCFGTLSASFYFMRRGMIDIKKLIMPIIAIASGALIGTLSVQFLKTQWLQIIIPLLLIAVALIFLLFPNFGLINKKMRMSYPVFAATIALPIGFYDGFLGPGTGSFFLLALITINGLTLQQATIEAKVYNATSNVISFITFFILGNIIWSYGIAMACGQLIGARIASKIIIRKGATFIRPMVIIVSITMSVVLAHRYWF